MELCRTPDPRRREAAYQLLNGFIETVEGGPLRSIEYTQLEQLTAQIYQHRLKLCARADLDFEDEDMEAIVSTYEQLNRLCADLMYNQGWHDANQE